MKATVHIWRLRVPAELVAKVKQMAILEQRSTTKQAAVLLDEAIGRREYNQRKSSIAAAAMETYGRANTTEGQ